MTVRNRIRLTALLTPLLVPAAILASCGDDDTSSAAPTATEPAPTEEPANEEPATEAPATEAPATEEPATEEPATEAPTTEEPTAEPATEAPTTEEPTAETGNRVEVEFSGGSVVGGAARVPVALGEEVTIILTSDVADELHLHGYDLFADVDPSAPAELTFVADIPGVFEAELEGLGVPVVEIEVS